MATPFVSSYRHDLPRQLLPTITARKKVNLVKRVALVVQILAGPVEVLPVNVRSEVTKAHPCNPIATFYLCDNFKNSNKKI